MLSKLACGSESVLALKITWNTSLLICGSSFGALLLGLDINALKRAVLLLGFSKFHVFN